MKVMKKSVNYCNPKSKILSVLFRGYIVYCLGLVLNNNDPAPVVEASEIFSKQIFKGPGFIMVFHFRENFYVCL